MYETVRNESGLVTVLVTAVKEYYNEDKKLCSCDFDMLKHQEGNISYLCDIYEFAACNIWAGLVYCFVGNGRCPFIH